MKRTGLFTTVRILVLAGLIGGGASLSPGMTSATEGEIEVAQPDAIRINLERFIGKRVMVKLVGGGELEGVARKIGPTTLHLSELSGKEFYDAVVRLDHISVVIARVKTK